MGYINADTIKRHKIITHYPGDYHNGWNDAIDEILEDKRADVQEVRHGKWLFVVGNCKEELWMCNQCERCIRTEQMEKNELIKRYPYCHCGAKMDEKDEK